ncbi:S1 family peptidase [Conyzicola sp.]|uniref:S1 family peptidase n=1 Tax=Conyzicola sp. TaxID=1969404 RepID=UPI0039896833
MTTPTLRHALTSGGAALLLVAVGLVAMPTSATAATAATEPPVTMGDYAASDFAEAASALPDELVTALSRDLGVSAATYLAEAAAATDAVEVVDALADAGVDVAGSSIDGTTLTVNVSDPADAALVEKAGAVAETDAPAPVDLAGVEFYSVADIFGGEAITWQTGNTVGRCSVGFAGFATGSGQPQLATAGHCLAGMAGMTGQVNAITQSAPGAPATASSPIGLPVAGSQAFGNGFDSGLVAATAAGFVAYPAVATWGGGAGAPRSSAALPVQSTSAAIVGATLCKSGSTTGWTCGTVRAIDSVQRVNDNGGSYDVNSIIATTCVLSGDSGGSALIGQTAVGVTSASSSATACGGANYASTFFPMVSPTGKSVTAAYGGGWEPAVSVSTPVVTGASGGTPSAPGTITGTLAAASAASTVGVYLDGASTPAATASAASGAWSLALPAMAAGAHSYSVKARWGTWSVSAPADGGVTVAAAPGPTNGSAALVMALYRDVLFRSAAPDEVRGWSAIVASGQSITGGFLLSDEYRLNKATSAYRTILGREPEAGAIYGWLGLMRNGSIMTEDLDKQFYGSTEYFNNSGATNAGFVSALYKRLIGRPAAADEVSGWSAYAAQNGRLAVVNAIWGAIETARSRVSAIYFEYLGRYAEESETYGWAVYGQNYGDAQLRSAITGSQEYYERSMARFPGAQP